MNYYRVATVITLLALSNMFLGSNCVLKAADVVVTLDLQLDDSGNANGGGAWSLFGRIDNPTVGVDGSIGLAAVNAIINGIDYGTEGDLIFLSDTIGALNPIITPFGSRFPALDVGGGTIDLLYGQVISTAQTTGVGVNTTSGLFDTLIASGTYSGAAPTFTNSGSSFTDANLLTSTTSPFSAAAPDNVITQVVTLGDTTGDGLVTLLDIQPFVDAVSAGASVGEAAFASDLDQSGLVTLLDIQLFVDLLSSSSSAGIVSVPEPATGFLFFTASLVWGCLLRGKTRQTS